MSDVLFTPLAARDLEEIAEYIAQDNPRRAAGFVQKIREQCQKIASSPLGYPERSDIVEGLRSCAIGNYLIFFQPRDGAVLIVRILHGARDIAALFDEER